MLSNQERINRGWDAQTLLDEITPYFDELTDAILHAFQNAPVRDKKGIMGLRYKLLALESVKAAITSKIMDGNMAVAELDIDHGRRN